MNAPESRTAKASVFLPDPVIEYYMTRVDRAAIREQLAKTPAERLEWLQDKVNQAATNSITREEPPPWPGKKKTIEMGADLAWSAAARAIPLLVSDPVIEAYVEDVDRGLIRQALRLAVPERFEKFLQLTNQSYALRRACVLKDRELETDFQLVLRTLVNARIDFITVGAVAAIAQGVIATTEDVDVVYSRHPENLRKIVAALTPFEPYLRGAPPGLPFRLDERFLRNGLNFTFETTMGNLDLLGEVSGGGTFEELKPFAERKRAFGVEFFSVSLDKLILLKRAAGRPKDFEMVARLEVARQEKIAAEQSQSGKKKAPG